MSYGFLPRAYHRSPDVITIGVLLTIGPPGIKLFHELPTRTCTPLALEWAAIRQDLLGSGAGENLPFLRRLLFPKLRPTFFRGGDDAFPARSAQLALLPDRGLLRLLPFFVRRPPFPLRRCNPSAGRRAHRPPRSCRRRPVL